VAKLLRRLWRNELRRGFTALSGSATNTNKTWTTGTTNNPDQDLLTDLITATTATGIRPNRIVYGDSAWNSRRIAYANVTNTATAYSAVMNLTPEALAQTLMVDKVLISRERYQSGSATKAEALGQAIYAYFAEDGVDTEDPSNIKRFTSSFSGEQGGGLVRVYVQQISSKLVAITVEHYSKIVVTYTGGIRKWTIS